MNIALTALESGHKAAPYENIEDHGGDSPRSPRTPKNLDPDIVNFADGDPENPHNWPKGKKMLALLTFCMMGFIVTLTSTVVAPATTAIKEHYKVEKTEVAMLGVCLSVLGWATGPLFCAPASEIWGRNRVYIPMWFIFILFNIGAALSRSMAAFLACRLLSGIFASPIIAIAPATAYDMYKVHDVGPPSFMLAILSLIGSAVGEIIGGYISQYAGWRWTLWLPAILSGLHMGAVAMLPETHHNTILARKAERMRRDMGLPTLHTRYDNHSLPKSIIFQTAILRPLQLLALEPIVWLCSLALGFVWGVLYLYIGAYLILFRKVYRWDAGNSGAAFSGIGVGIILAVFAAPAANRVYVKLSLKHGNGRIYPEGRLPPAMLAMVIIPVSMFWFAWSVRRDVHWIVPILSGVPYGFGQVLLFMSFMSYTSDCFPTMTASAGAATSLFRLLFAMGFPLFAPTLYASVNVHWAGSILAFVAVALAPIPFIFYKYGPYIRSRSRFSPKYT
ncbi:major facilitator superfamily domain-containing protein [Geopyxis carbonaria]|nr:major facilitator superfamily domain-containing protein [Geopyxis carbonaria]